MVLDRLTNIATVLIVVIMAYRVEIYLEPNVSISMKMMIWEIETLIRLSSGDHILLVEPIIVSFMIFIPSIIILVNVLLYMSSREKEIEDELMLRISVILLSVIQLLVIYGVSWSRYRGTDYTYTIELRMTTNPLLLISIQILYVMYILIRESIELGEVCVFSGPE